MLTPEVRALPYNSGLRHECCVSPFIFSHSLCRLFQRIEWWEIDGEEAEAEYALTLYQDQC
jgi:hypothetical protein